MALCFSCSEDPHYTQHQEHIAMKTYLALGDSYTIGEGVDTQGRWPDQLVEGLNEAGCGISEPLIIARTGWTTAELNAGMDEAGVTGTFDMVSLLIGVNNQFRGLDSGSYRLELRALLQRAIDLAGENATRVMVVSIPDYGVTPFGLTRDPERIAREIDAFNGIKRDESERAGASWVDVTEISRRAATEPELIAADQLHPSAEMYALWVKEIIPVARKIVCSTSVKP